MPLTDRMTRPILWKFNRSTYSSMYGYLSRHADDDVIFLNCAYEQDPPMAIPLEPGDEPYRCSIQLYHATETQHGALTGKQILEVGCGHGGGASYLTRRFRPASYTGMELNTPAWEAVWDRYAPRFMRPVSHAPIKGETLYRDIESGNQSYRMYCFTKA